MMAVKRMIFMMILMKMISGGKVQSLIGLEEFPASHLAIISRRFYNGDDDDERNPHNQLKK